MLEYNTQLKHLALPEYGRNIQKMVDYCLTIPDREQRTKCAYAVINAMGNLFPAFRDGEDRFKLWDHLAIMSDFELDIDYPCEVIQQESLMSQPEKVFYNTPISDRRHYGRYLLSMIQRTAEMPEGIERDAMVLLVANQMKKTMLIEGDTESIEDIKIFNDLAAISHGAIRLTPETCTLHDYKINQLPGKKKKKK